MHSVRITSLPYQANPCIRFARIRHLPQAILLDSCHDSGKFGRFDIMSAMPAQQLKVTHQQLHAEKKPLNYYLSCAAHWLDELSPINSTQTLPFLGGLMGWISYEAAHQDYKLNPKSTTHELPAIQLSLYLWAIINDHQEQQSYLIAHPDCDPALVSTIEELISASHPESNRENFSLHTPWASNLSRSAYSSAFDKIQRYIRAGDCYQINLAQRFTAHFEGNTWHAYQQLRQASPAPYAAFIPTQHGDILSLSPESFLKISDNKVVETKPIKGTAPRFTSVKEDEESANTLLKSEKNRAENLMIVDLLRNDLGQCCQPGSIAVDKLFALESYASVHHLVSTIRGQLSSDKTPIDIIAAAFPGGSITGAPKKRAMEIIDELEPDTRSIYCGSIGYLSCHNASEFNIAIRTLLTEDNAIHCWAGGGIVADSHPDDEYQETFNKVNKLLNGLS